MLNDLLQNPAFLALICVVAVVFLAMNGFTAFAILRGRKGNIEDAMNRDKKAMDELHRRVEELKNLGD